MKKPRPRLHAKPSLCNTTIGQRNISPTDLFLYARSFHNAAKSLAAAVSTEPAPFGNGAACPVVFMYRHAVELHLKAIVLGEGGNFLATRPDPISVQKTHSASWLPQFVCQIVTALKWESEFMCEGIGSLADFKAVIEEVNSVDPGFYTFRLPVDPHAESGIRDFAKRMDAVIDLLESTGEALAAEWDLRSEPAENDAFDGLVN